MNSLWGTELYYTPDYWPAWLILAGIIVAVLLAALAIHGFLRYALRPKQQPKEEEYTYLYSKAVRIWHWGNALLFILLLTSGMLNHFTIGNVPAQVELHKICGYLIVAFWLGFIVINTLSDNGVHYRIRWRGFVRRCFRQINFYLFGIMRGDPHPFIATEQSKFNPVQQLAYIAVMYVIMPLLLISGLLSLFPQTVGYGYWLLKAHFVLAIVGLMFILVHVYLCTTGDTLTQTFKSMVDGYHRHWKHRSSNTAKQTDDKP